MIKFQRYNTQNIFTPGRLTLLAKRLIGNKERLLAKDKLTTSDMSQIPKMFAKLDPDFVIEEIKNDDTLTTSDNKEFTGADFKALIAIMYKCSRGSYWYPKENQLKQSSLCAATPLPLVGFKRFKNIPYSYFQLPSEYFEDFLTIKKEHIKDLYNLDRLLGYGLRSTIYQDGVVNLSEAFGLGMFGSVDKEKVRFSPTLIKQVRELSLGNRSGSVFTSFGASKVTSVEVDDIGLEYWLNLYNNGNSLIKHMLTQRWVYYTYHRSEDMITNPFDWDKLMPALDTPSTSIKGLTPQKDTTTGLEEYGL
jgi:hypothetical protein